MSGYIVRVISEIFVKYGVQLVPFSTNRPIVPAWGDYDIREIGGIIGRGNQSTQRKSSSVPLCPP
jgi:hypothetical protein